jgi:hypothetical protein
MAMVEMFLVMYCFVLQRIAGGGALRLADRAHRNGRPERVLRRWFDGDVLTEYRKSLDRVRPVFGLFICPLLGGDLSLTGEGFYNGFS